MTELTTTIVVTIKNQPFDNDKYLGKFGCACYLEEALLAAGYEDIKVYGFGETHIGDVKYETTDRFNSETVERDLTAGRDITVTLRYTL